MKLTLESLQSITTGAVSVTQQDGWFCFHRFSQAPAVYFPSDDSSQAKVTANSSIKLDFVTDARQISFQYLVTRASSRKLFFFDLYVNDALVTTRGCADTDTQFAGQFSWSLPQGEKHITLYLPNLYAMRVKDFTLEDASCLLPAPRCRKLLAFGDSITQGYDAVHPSLSYANRMAFHLDADITNKGIGGDVFHPELIDDYDLKPDIITVAYGTNDWSHGDRSSLIHNAEAFLTKLRSTYPDAKIFVITPIWRRDNDRITDCGKFEEVGPTIRGICQTIPGICVIDGFTLAAHMAEMLSDHVHPNDLGHMLYGTSLASQIAKHL